MGAESVFTLELLSDLQYFLVFQKTSARKICGLYILWPFSVSSEQVAGENWLWSVLEMHIMKKSI